MSKKLAIKGHPTRGEKVIELLKMMGGRSDCGVSGSVPHHYYYLNTPTYIDAFAFESDFFIRNKNNFAFYTLEEFLDEYPFKIGDKVVDGYGNLLTIKAMSWSEDCETMVYDFEDAVIVLAAEDIEFANAEFLVNKEKSEEVGKMLCDRTLNHLHGNHLKNVLSELYEHIKTTPKEDLEREFKEIESEGWTNVGTTVEEFMDFCNKVNKKPKYPDNYEECVRNAKNIHGYDIYIDASAYGELMESFVKLLICRDAYWKIAGEQMGLGKPWEPDWNKLELKYTIVVIENKSVKHYNLTQNFILAFPTEEMRDAFYENFKDLIKQCKELL